MLPEGDAHVFGEIRSGALGARLAVTQAEIEAAQTLRYRVFYDEMGANPDPAIAATGRDRDAYDQVADHILIVDHAIGPGPEGVVGTYRLIRREAADKIGRFYSADEYDIAALLALPGRVLELGRSCIRADYRGRAAMQLLWRGVAAYVFQHRIDIMFGCASLPGTDPDALAAELTYLYYHHLAPAAAGRGGGALCGYAPPGARFDRCPPRAGAAAAADQRVSAPGRLRRRRCGDRPSVQHHGCRRGGQDRPRD
jgi:putative hemolysin